MGHVWDDFKIGAERPRSEINTAQSCFLVIVHIGSWHPRLGEDRHIRPPVRHHDPLVTKALQESVVWECEVVLKIVVDLLLFCLQKRSHTHTHACVVCVHSHMITPQLAHISAEKSHLCKVNTRASYVRAPRFYKNCGDLVMFAWNKHELIDVLVFFIILLALFGPCTPTIAVLLERFWNSHDLVIHEEFVRREI